MTPVWLYVVAGACGVIVIALLVLQMVLPSAPLLPVALVVGAVGAVIARAITMLNRRK